ncbi:MAG: peptidase T [Spirochaetaceae bacterium]|jgi:tripeptide aminopeptidase|nr:peptidase T [Spirochaetaceae bacterium]
MTDLARQFRRNLLERFLRYAGVRTTSDTVRADKGIVPSSPGELELAEIIAEELRALGIAEVAVTTHGYLCARIPAGPGCACGPPVCLLAHLDTVETVSGADVRPCVFEGYDGTAITLEGGAALDPAADAELAAAKGETIITSDGRTLLGADDKAGVAEIVTLMEILLAHREIPHGEIEIILSPDEETGHGMDFVPTQWMHSRHCLTLDGSGLGEIECECFNAWKSRVVFTGVARHTGTARPAMVNAVSLAADFVSLLPRHESPETTDGRQGFYAPHRVSGTMEDAEVTVLLRDFDAAAMEKRLKIVEQLAQAVIAGHTGSTVTVTHTRQYVNMRESLEKQPVLLNCLVRAAKSLGVTPVFKPIRGGTDGSRLTEMGYPTPNMWTGGHNFHSPTEWASLDQMEKALAVLIEFVVQFAYENI